MANWRSQTHKLCLQHARSSTLFEGCTCGTQNELQGVCCLKSWIGPCLWKHSCFVCKFRGVLSRMCLKLYDKDKLRVSPLIGCWSEIVCPSSFYNWAAVSCKMAKSEMHLQCLEFCNASPKSSLTFFCNRPPICMRSTMYPTTVRERISTVCRHLFFAFLPSLPKLWFLNKIRLFQNSTLSIEAPL